MIALSKAIVDFKLGMTDKFDEHELNQIVNILLETELKISRLDFITKEDLVLSAADVERLNEIKQGLLNDAPLAQLLGKWEFYGLDFKVNESTLIPRPETEELVQLVLDSAIDESLTILDIGTGSGCIPISIKKNRPSWKVLAMDVSKEALVIAEQNALLNEVDVEFEQFDILKGKRVKHDNQFDVVVSNPPYIPNAERFNMDKSVVNYEPSLALFVEDDQPLVFYDAVVEYARINLKPGGGLYVECHHGLAQKVGELFSLNGFENVQVLSDINQKERMVAAKLKE